VVEFVRELAKLSTPNQNSGDRLDIALTTNGIFLPISRSRLRMPGSHV